VQVGQGGNPPTNWKTAYTCASNQDTTFNSYILSAAELSNGAPVVRLWDNHGPVDTAQGTTDIDVLRIDRTEYRTGFLPWDYYVEKMVNADNGNLHLEFRDLTVKALGWPLEIVRSYNAFLATGETLMGRGWTFTYDTRLVEEATGIVQWWDPDGSVHTFRYNGTAYVPPPGIDAKLTKSAAYALWFKDGSRFDFNATTNRLAKMTDRNGNTVTLTWTSIAPIRLTSLMDASGLQLNFTYRISGPVARITQVQDPIGRMVKYAYDGNGDLRTYTDAMGNNTYFVYDGSHRMLTWREPGDPSGAPAPVVRKVTFAYDTSDHVTQVKYAAVNSQTNATQYEYVAWGLAYVAATFPGADHAMNATNPRSVMTTINVDTSGSPMDVKGPQCGECASLVQSPNQGGATGCACSGGCGTSSIGMTEELTLTWDSNRDLLTRNDKTGHQYNYTYDTRRNLLQTKDPLGNVTINVWTNVDNATAYVSTLNKTTNPRGFTWFYEYDAKGNLKQLKDPTNNVSKYQYTSKGYLSRYFDWRGYNTTFDYNSHGYLLNRTDATGNKTTYQNDGVGRVTKMTTPKDNAWQTQYDKDDRVTKTIDPLNNATTFTYVARGDLVSRRDALGRVTQLAWNVTNLKVAQSMDALGNATTDAYDLAGNLAKVTNPRGFNTTFTYDNFNRRTVDTDALGNQTRYAYDGDGLVTSIRNRRGFYTNSTYDALHRRITLKDSLGNVTTFFYDQTGNILKIRNAREFNTTFNFDALNRLTTRTDALGNVTRFAYDANGNLVNRTDPNGDSNAFTLDPLNRGTVSRNGLGKAMTSSYDSESNVVQVKDANGNTTKFDYDAVGNKLNLTDANGHKTVQSFDALNRLKKSTTSLGKVTNYTYDANGNPTARRDPNGNTTTYTFDALDRVVRILYPNATFLAATYDAEGNTLVATGFGFSRTDSWDPLNRISAITVNFGPFSKAMSYTYDQVGNRKTMTYPEGQTITYTWDALNRLTNLQDSNLGNWTFGYDAGSRRATLRHPTGVKTTYTYNGADWATKLETKTSGGIILERFNYTYDNVGNELTAMEENGNTSNFVYDSTNRLRSESYTGGLTINYTYDGADNRLTEKRNGVTSTYAYDADNRLVAKGSTTYAYNDNGNLLSKSVSGQGTSTYKYDFENRLTKISLPNSTSEDVQYDARGKRVSVSLNGAKTYFMYDFYDFSKLEDRIADYTTSGSLVGRYVHGPGPDEPLAEVHGSTVYFYHANAIGSVTTLTTNSQSIVANYEYEAFGNLRGSGSSVVNPFTFTAREAEPIVGLSYYRHRWYNPADGRFLIADPWMFVDGPNLYAYVRNNPINRIDPDGLGCRTACFNGGGTGGKLSFCDVRSPCYSIGCCSAPSRPECWDILQECQLGVHYYTDLDCVKQKFTEDCACVLLFLVPVIGTELAVTCNGYTPPSICTICVVACRAGPVLCAACLILELISIWTRCQRRR